MTEDKPRQKIGKSIAVVSGKGGSGKTLLATAMGVELAESGHSVVLVDADLGTAGLSYYLGFSAFSGARGGVADIVANEDWSSDIQLSYPTSETERYLRKDNIGSLTLLPIGDHRRSLRANDEFSGEFGNLSRAINILRTENEVVIIDCRGGVDRQSLEVCSIVDEIVMVVETDAASIKASQHLTDTLSDHGLSSKVAGFFLNKVMDDPRPLANAGRSFFSAPYLASVPFELETTRDFIRGFLPRPGSLFRKQANLGLHKLLPTLDLVRYSNYMTDQEFTVLSTEPPEMKVGRTFVGILTAVTVVFYISYWGFGNFGGVNNSALSEAEQAIVRSTIFIILSLMTIFALSATLLGALGRFVRFYIQVFDRVLQIYARLFRFR
ncbi:AAA family ATPase [Agrobacterium sp. 16-172Ci]